MEMKAPPRFNSAAVAKSLQSCLTVRPRGLQPTRLLHPWDFPGKSTGVGCHVYIIQEKSSRNNFWSIVTKIKIWIDIIYALSNI